MFKWASTLAADTSPEEITPIMRKFEEALNGELKLSAPDYLLWLDDSCFVEDSFSLALFVLIIKDVSRHII